MLESVSGESVRVPVVSAGSSEERIPGFLFGVFEVVRHAGIETRSAADHLCSDLNQDALDVVG